jgi:hypothetical protein
MNRASNDAGANMAKNGPESDHDRDADGVQPQLVPSSVSLRDYLAGQALAGMCAAAAEPAYGRAMQLKIAETAYQIADAMMEKRGG